MATIIQGSVEPIYRCTSCGAVYLDKVTQCDCMPKVQEFLEGIVTFPKPFIAGENDLTGKWCYSTDGESYSGRFDTEDAARGAAIDDLHEFCEDDIEFSYWLARCCHPLDSIKHDKRLLWSGERFMEQVEEWCADEISADDWILDMTEDDKVALGKLVFDFIRSRAKIQYYGITDAVEYKHTFRSE